MSSLLAWWHVLDLHLLYLINQTWSRPWLDPIMARVSDFNSFKLPLALGVILVLVFGKFRGRLFLVLMAACLLFGDALLTQTFKILVHRPRPNETEPHLRVVSVGEITESRPQPPTGRGSSFTSGHACNNVALAMVGCAVFGRWALLLWPWALLVSYSRVYCASHYPSDIAGSWLVAILYSILILGLASWLWQREGPRRWPELHARHPRLYPAWSRRVQP